MSRRALTGAGSVGVALSAALSCARFGYEPLPEGPFAPLPNNTSLTHAGGFGGGGGADEGGTASAGGAGGGGAAGGEQTRAGQPARAEQARAGRRAAAAGRVRAQMPGTLGTAAAMRQSRMVGQAARRWRGAGPPCLRRHGLLGAIVRAGSSRRTP